jgi:hypothetical protein
MIDSMFQEGTDRAISDAVQRPQKFKPEDLKFSAGSLFTSPFKGVGAGVSETIAFQAELVGAFGQVMAAGGAESGGGMFSPQSPDERKQGEAARRKLLNEGIDFSNEAGDNFRQRAAEIMPDPQTSHASEQLVAGVTKFATKAVTYAVGGGPLAPVGLGLDEGLAEADRLKQQGVDLSTRTKVGAVAGAVAGASIVLPVAGKTVAGTVGLVAASGPGGFVAQNAGSAAILEHAGYDKIASQYDPLDPVGLALSTLVPGAFGAFAMRGRAKPIAPLKNEADVRQAAALTPAEQARSDAFERSPGNIAELEAAIKAEKNASARLVLIDELEVQRRAARENATRDAVRNEPDAVPAARVQQVVDAIDVARLTAANDIRGAEAHVDALTLAHEQIARGEQVQVAQTVSLPAPVQLFDGQSTTVALRTGEAVTIERRVDPKGGVPNPDAPVAAARNAPSELIARTSDGQEIGRMSFDNLGGAPDVSVATAFQRKGLATAFYDIAESSGGQLAAADAGTVRSPAGQAFRESRAARQAESPAARVERTARALDELRAARRPPEPAAPRIPAKPAADAQTKADAPKPPAAANAATNEVDAPAATAASEVAALNPDLMVQLEGMNEPMRVGDLLSAVREEAAQDLKERDLVTAAANCFLRAG